MNTIQPIDRPRERIKNRGVESLSDIELVAAIFGSGGPQQNVFELAKNVVTIFEKNLANPKLEDLLCIKGIGLAKASQILSAIEFAKRRIHPERRKITNANDVMPLLWQYAEKRQEHFICISLNGANGVIAARVITIGLVNCTQVHPREVFSDPIVDRASAIIVAHNHPTGDLTPSTADRKVTKELKDAGNILGIKLLDHIIFSTLGYFSFSDASEL